MKKIVFKQLLKFFKRKHYNRWFEFLVEYNFTLPVSFSLVRNAHAIDHFLHVLKKGEFTNVFKGAVTDMRYFARSEFSSLLARSKQVHSRSLVHEKIFSLT